MDKKLLIEELERYIDFCNKTRLTKEDGIACAGYTQEEIDKFPPNAPGIHPYWDDEMESIQVAEGLISWAKTGELPFNPNLYKNTFQCKINLINYLILNPQFENIIIGECGRGIEILLSLWVKNDWNKIYCFDFRGIYKKLVDDFFSDERIVFHEQQSCYFDFNLILEDNLILVLTHSMPHSLKHFIECSKLKMIIKEGVIVDQTKHWREHKPEEIYENIYEELKNKILTRKIYD